SSPHLSFSVVSLVLVVHLWRSKLARPFPPASALLSSSGHLLRLCGYRVRQIRSHCLETGLDGRAARSALVVLASKFRLLSAGGSRPADLSPDSGQASRPGRQTARATPVFSRCGGLSCLFG